LRVISAKKRSDKHGFHTLVGNGPRRARSGLVAQSFQTLPRLFEDRPHLDAACG
jgi:hypothetical protein